MTPDDPISWNRKVFTVIRQYATGTSAGATGIAGHRRNVAGIKEPNNSALGPFGYFVAQLDDGERAEGDRRSGERSNQFAPISVWDERWVSRSRLFMRRAFAVTRGVVGFPS